MKNLRSKRRWFGAWPIAAAIALAAACSSSEGSGTSVRPPPKVTQCQPPYTDLTTLTLKQETQAGACASDTDAVCANPLGTQANECAFACANMGGAASSLGACTLACLQKNAKPAPSNACLDCYVSDTQCTSLECASECVAGDSPACTTCRVDNGCVPAFLACSGLPAVAIAPTGSAGAGGVSGAAGAGGVSGAAGASGVSEGGAAGASTVSGAGGAGAASTGGAGAGGAISGTADAGSAGAPSAASSSGAGGA